MMGRLNQDQGRLFYSFCLDEVVPSDHLVRQIAAVLDLSWIHAEFTLAAIAQNLRRLATLTARPPPIAAMAVA